MKVLAWLRKWWGLIAAMLGVLGAAIAYVLVPPKDEDERLAQTLDAAKKRAEDKMAAANARHAIELHVIATKDEQAKAQLEAILAEPDEARRQNALIAMRLRVRQP